MTYCGLSHSKDGTGWSVPNDNRCSFSWCYITLTSSPQSSMKGRGENGICRINKTKHEWCWKQSPRREVHQKGRKHNTYLTVNYQICHYTYQRFLPSCSIHRFQVTSLTSVLLRAIDTYKLILKRKTGRVLELFSEFLADTHKDIHTHIQDLQSKMVYTWHIFIWIEHNYIILHVNDLSKSESMKSTHIPTTHLHQ